MAKKKGFEPSMDCYTHTRFPIVRLQPLGHFFMCVLIISENYYKMNTFSIIYLTYRLIK